MRMLKILSRGRLWDRLGGVAALVSFSPFADSHRYCSAHSTPSFV
jgi:hypothetical protein